MVDTIKEFWHDQIPGWFPVLIAIVGAAFWIGQQQQHISDRLDSVEKQIQAMQEYLRTSHAKTDDGLPPVSSVKPKISVTSRPDSVYAEGNDLEDSNIPELGASVENSQ